jgi:cobalamin synthase
MDFIFGKFLVLYSSSLVVLVRHLSASKQQAYGQNALSKVQRKVFITVSYALFCYGFFYGIPTIMQMICYVCKFGYLQGGSKNRNFFIFAKICQNCPY